MPRLAFALARRSLRFALSVAVPVGLTLLVLASPFRRGVLEGGRRVIGLITERTTGARLAAPIVVERLQALNRLETARQVSHQVVEVKSSSPLLGDFLSRDQLVMTAQTEVIAGIDLSRLSTDDVIIEGDSVTVVLPPAEVFSARLDDQNTRVHVRDRGLLVFNLDKDLERRARLEAVAGAREAAGEARILDTARSNAEANLRELLRSLGVDDVAFAERRPEEAPAQA